MRLTPIKFMYLLDQYHRRREWEEYLAAVMPYTYVKSLSKKKVDFQSFMALYGGKKKAAVEEYMDADEIVGRVEGLAKRLGGRVIKEPADGD